MKIFEITFCGTCKLNCKSVTVDIKAGNMSKNVFKIVYDSFFFTCIRIFAHRIRQWKFVRV